MSMMFLTYKWTRMSAEDCLKVQEQERNNSSKTVKEVVTADTKITKKK